ncbi:MAG: hypothetical protein RL329_3111 [Bacteroidota bacterium]
MKGAKVHKGFDQVSKLLRRIVFLRVFRLKRLSLS